MPPYATSGSESQTLNTVAPTILYPGDEKYLFGTVGANPIPGISQAPNDSNVQFETVSLDERSIAIALTPRPGGGSAPGLMVYVVANANPGVAEIDVQDAGVDADGAYETPTSSAAYKITTFTQEGSVWVGYTELQPEGGHFITLLIVANPNAVQWTAKAIYV